MNINEQIKKLELEIVSYGEGLEKNKEKATKYWEIANLYLNNNINKAIENFEKAIEFNNESHIYVFKLAEVYEKLGKYDLAIEQLDKAIRLDNQPGYIFFSAIVYMKLENYKKAAEKFEQIKDCIDKSVLSFHTNNNQPVTKDVCYYELAYCYSKISNWDKAVENIDIAIKLNPNDSKYYYDKDVYVMNRASEKTGKLDIKFSNTFNYKYGERLDRLRKMEEC